MISSQMLTSLANTKFTNDLYNLSNTMLYRNRLSSTNK